MKTIERFVLVARSRMGIAPTSTDPVRISPQADMMAEAVDLQLESFRSHIEREMTELERRLTQPKSNQPETSAARFDPE